MIRYLRSVALTTLGVGAWPALAAQTTAAPARAVCQGVVGTAQVACADRVSKLQPALVDPSSTRIVLSPVNALQLGANTDDKKKTATARIGLIDGDGKGGTLATQLTLSGPLDENNDRTELGRVADLTSLSDQTTAKLTLNRTQWTFKVDSGGLHRACDRIIHDQDSTSRARALRRARTKEDSAKANEQLVKDSTARATNRASGNPYDWCFAGSDDLPTGHDDELTAFVDPGAPFTFGAYASAGRRDVRYADASTLADSTTRINSFGFGAVAGWVFPRALSTFIVTYDYVNSKKAGKATQICSPLNGTTTLACRNTTSGKPSEDDRQVGGVEYRRAISGNRGFGVRLEADWGDAPAMAVEVPLYLLGSLPGGTNGGVVLGFGTERHVFSITAFVGAMSPPLLPNAGK